MKRILMHEQTDNVLAYGWGSLMAFTSLFLVPEIGQILAVVALNLVVPIVTKLCMRIIDNWFDRRKQRKELDK